MSESKKVMDSVLQRRLVQGRKIFFLNGSSYMLLANDRYGPVHTFEDWQSGFRLDQKMTIKKVNFSPDKLVMIVDYEFYIPEKTDDVSKRDYD